MKIKTVLKCAAVCSFASFLVACGNGGSSNSTKEIEFFSQKPEMQATLQEIVDDYNKSQDDVKVTLTSVPDPGTVLKTRIANGETPDVVNIYPQNADFKGWAKDGQFVDLTAEKDILGNLNEGAAEAYAVDDKIYNVPLTTNVSGIYYNKTAFEKLGIEVPKSLAEFQEIVKKIKDDGQTPFAEALGDAWTVNGFAQLAWIQSAGSADKANDVLRFSDKGGIKSDEVTKNVAAYLDLLAGNGQSNSDGALYADTVAAFAEGKALMMANGSWALTVINQQQPDFEVGFFAMPGLTADAPAMTVGAADMAVSVSADSKNVDEAKEFVKYLSSAEAVQKYYDVDGSPTSVKGVNTDGKFKELADVAALAFTDKQAIWLHSEWTSEETFWDANVSYIKNKDLDGYIGNLNTFFDTMK
ncbi:multiple sugar-binding protein [Streptococcus dysgalactiae subsp. equisimilis]|uniref:Multiple sugar-binding protein n=1 Tax=Streptococcus dysgalactiae subsp. equisimilis TaxID=119602 RepID=A0A9X8T2U7_STREQ|nr:extracellular solute-binding protein [Streptococcus dysgalactiae]SUN63298.1 multiple sugar-binding protein [Streptococcus dysgalactiae subsp. equisimilis]